MLWIPVRAFCIQSKVITSTSLSLQRRVHAVFSAEGPESFFSGASAALPHALHRTARLLQRHRDLYHLGRRGRTDRLGQRRIQTPAWTGNWGCRVSNCGSSICSPVFQRKQRWTLRGTCVMLNTTASLTSCRGPGAQISSYSCPSLCNMCTVCIRWNRFSNKMHATCTTLYFSTRTLFKTHLKALIISVDIGLWWCIFPNKFSIKLAQTS